ATHRSAASRCHIDASRRDSPSIIYARGHTVASPRPVTHPKLFHEELLFSSRLEDGKKVPSIISRTEENATVEGDATRRRVLQGRRIISVVATDWAQSTHRFSTCERDRGVHRVLNATALVVVFLFPLFGLTSSCAPHVARGVGLADVGSGKAMATYVVFRSRCRATSCSQPLCVFKKVWPNRAVVCSARSGAKLLRFLWAIRRLSVVFGALSSQGHRMERGRRRAVGGLRVLREGSEIPPGYIAWIATCVVPSRSVSSVLDTLTPVFELYVRLRERRQRTATCVVLVGLYCSLACACGVAVGLFVLDCETESSTKEMWDKLKLIYEGSSKVKETKFNILFHEYDMFKMSSVETISDMFVRLSKIINRLKALGKNYTDTEIVCKILRSLPPAWHTKATVIEDSKNLSNLTMEELIGSLMTYEINLKREEAEQPIIKQKDVALKAKMSK
ncbi:hypothetical protein Taro_043024, partial [Colocasia esculenta]|nr:hypothetical protein [Colocasia esculenta]